jgi:hypothetical protein
MQFLPLFAALTPLTAALVNLSLTGRLQPPVAILLWLCAAGGMAGLLWLAALRLRAIDEGVEGLLQTTQPPSVRQSSASSIAWPTAGGRNGRSSNSCLIPARLFWICCPTPI